MKNVFDFLLCVQKKKRMGIHASYMYLQALL